MVQSVPTVCRQDGCPGLHLTLSPGRPSVCITHSPRALPTQSSVSGIRRQTTRRPPCTPAAAIATYKDQPRFVLARVFPPSFQISRSYRGSTLHRPAIRPEVEHHTCTTSEIIKFLRLLQTFRGHLIIINSPSITLFME